MFLLTTRQVLTVGTTDLSLTMFVVDAPQAVLGGQIPPQCAHSTFIIEPACIRYSATGLRARLPPTDGCELTNRKNVYHALRFRKLAVTMGNDGPTGVIQHSAKSIRAPSRPSIRARSKPIAPCNRPNIRMQSLLIRNPANSEARIPASPGGDYSIYPYKSLQTRSSERTISSA